MHQFLFLCACFAGFLFAIKNTNRVTRIKQSELIRLPAVILPHHISETVRNIIRLKREENNGKTVFSLPKIFVLINIPMAPAITNERIERSPSCAVGSGVLYAIIAITNDIVINDTASISTPKITEATGDCNLLDLCLVFIIKSLRYVF